MPASSRSIALALGALYLIWGSTYLGIKVAIESLPPFFMAGSRFVIAAAILFTLLRWKRIACPRATWPRNILVGACVVTGGNGFVTAGEQYISSAEAAILAAACPLLMTLFGWWAAVNTRPGWRIIAALLAGLAGVVLLVGGNDAASHPQAWKGHLWMAGAVLVFSAGSIWSKKHPSPANVWADTAQQMLAGGGINLLLGLALGESLPASPTLRSLAAFAYLTVVGSLLGFGAYVFVLRHCHPAVASTYAFVNPLVAVALGAWLLGERLTPSGGWGTLLILAGTAGVLWRNPPARRH